MKLITVQPLCITLEFKWRRRGFVNSESLCTFFSSSSPPPSSTHLLTYSSDSAAQACSLNLQMFSTLHPFLACDRPSLELGFLLMSFSLSGLYSRTVLDFRPLSGSWKNEVFCYLGAGLQSQPHQLSSPPPPAPATLNHKGA